MAQRRFVVCDVFSDRPLAGNALCVFTDAREMDADLMQALARETNLSETTFVLPPEQGGHFRVRIFTPGRELPIAGHPLIGTAVVLARVLPFDQIVLETGAGPVPLDIERAGSDVAGATMQQPAPRFEQLDDSDRLCRALGLEPRAVTVADNGVRTALVEAGSVAELSGLAPDLGTLSTVEAVDVWYVYVPGDPVRVRSFAPAAGVGEDAGTGVAAGPLGVHLGHSCTILQGVELKRPCTITVTLMEGAGPRVQGAVVLTARGFYEV